MPIWTSKGPRFREIADPQAAGAGGHIAPRKMSEVSMMSEPLDVLMMATVLGAAHPHGDLLLHVDVSVEPEMVTMQLPGGLEIVNNVSVAETADHKPVA